MDIKLPSLGEGADSGTVVNVFVKEGDQLKMDQPVLELENEKAVAPIPSPAEGKVIQVRVKVGDKLTVGQVMLSLAEGDGAAPKRSEPSPIEGREAAPTPEATTERIEKVQEPSSAKAPPPGIPLPAPPSIRKLAKDLGVDLSKVRGSEPGGRIVLQDVRAYIQKLQQLAFASTPASTKESKPATPPAPQIDFAKWGPVRKEPLSTLRRTISQRMREAWTTIPHVTQFDEADITRLSELRKQQSEAKGAKLTLTCFALKAVVRVLQKYPIFNASLDESTQEVVYKDYFHIGLAVDTDSGLIVPVIRDVDKKDLVTLAKELAELAVKARDRKISLEELKGGTFTISNQGGIGGGHFTPIVNKPEVAILGLGRGALKPAVRNNQIEQRLILPVCLSYDHRLIDGGQAARFVVDLVQEFETFKEDEAKS
ncbi:MAG: branched-chain alpha-keto acid dehydrogenase subunit E2 [Verrucomicrobia bacterium]|nr:branched-chain alpha-keto acid dehydrogenase subunit E2 [Verrucomicrobiota bacterium]